MDLAKFVIDVARLGESYLVNTGEDTRLSDLEAEVGLLDDRLVQKVKALKEEFVRLQGRFRDKIDAQAERISRLETALVALSGRVDKVGATSHEHPTYGPVSPVSWSQAPEPGQPS